jgi:hypothetical protein
MGRRFLPEEATMPKVTKQFDGCPDGQVHPKTFMPGDTVSGDLGRVALAQGWATADAKRERQAAAKQSAAPTKRRHAPAGRKAQPTA